jgi:hypothetical protein
MAIIQQSSHNYFQMLHYGRRTHNNRAVFYGFEGVTMVLIMGGQNIMGSDYGSNISDSSIRVAARSLLTAPSSSRNGSLLRRGKLRGPR